MIKWLTSVLLVFNSWIIFAQMPDSEDVCPMAKGTKANKGCPDAANGTAINAYFTKDDFTTMLNVICKSELGKYRYPQVPA